MKQADHDARRGRAPADPLSGWSAWAKCRTVAGRLATILAGNHGDPLGLVSMVIMTLGKYGALVSFELASLLTDDQRRQLAARIEVSLRNTSRSNDKSATRELDFHARQAIELAGLNPL